jgi:ABC-2 type transport system permease protein
MQLDQAGYRTWDGRRRSPWWSCLAIVRVGLNLIFRRWVFWILIGLGLLNFLFHFAFIYLKATLVIQNENVAKFLDNYKVTGTGQAYADFMFAQASICALLLAFAGSTLIGSDYRQGGMIFYLSRRIGRWQYIVGKLLTIAAVVTIVTTLPALILYIEYGTLSNSMQYFLDNPRVLAGILGYGAVLAVVQSLMIFAIAAWVPRTVPLVMTWLGLFVLLKGLADAMRAIDGNRYWLLLGFWDDMHRVGRWCFGSLDEKRIPSAGYCLAVLSVLCVVSLILIVRRVRAVEVVS